MKKLRKAVCEANMALNRSGLVLFTWGNVSAVDRDRGVMVIKPSGVPYEKLSPENMVEVSLSTGKPAGSDLNPSSDAPAHLELYRAFPCSGIVHSHSEYATTLAQACIPVRCRGTTQADYFYGDIPLTRNLTKKETGTGYEKNTGLVIIETFKDRDPMLVPGVLVAHHGPFAWGTSADDAVHNAIVLEYVARMECMIRSMRPDAPMPAGHLIARHYLRKHGDKAYYGQRKRTSA